MLARVQEDFRATLLTDQPAAGDYVTGQGLAPEARLQIYRNHLFISLREALLATFPTVARLVGAGFFARVARDFIRALPPTSPCLFEYGAEFPAFLRSYEAARALPYLRDVAQLDWAINAAYHAEDAPLLSAEILRMMAPEMVIATGFALHPSVSLLESPYPIDAIWRANRKPEGEEDPVDLDQGGARLMIWRRGLDVEWRSFDQGEFAFLTAIADGQSLSEAASRSQEFDATFDLTMSLARLVGADILVGLLPARD